MKEFVTDACALDVRRLVREHWLLADTEFQWIWRDSHGAVRATIQVAVLDEALALIYPLRIGGQSCLTRQKIKVVSSSGSWGAVRQWFLCPQCGRRVAILYYDRLPFFCRRCANLAYPSQYPSQGRSYGQRYFPLRALRHGRSDHGRMITSVPSGSFSERVGICCAVSDARKWRKSSSLSPLYFRFQGTGIVSSPLIQTWAPRCWTRDEGGIRRIIRIRM